VADLLRERGFVLRGFVTKELREAGGRVGFVLETFDGERATLAHVDFSGPPRVGRYGVDLEVFELVALPALAGVEDGELVVIDELGKMELASSSFRSVVSELFGGRAPVVATVQLARHPFTDALKRDAQLVRVMQSNRDELPTRIAGRFARPDRGLTP
jgi:nucleoside-triphosphatase